MRSNKINLFYVAIFTLVSFSFVGCKSSKSVTSNDETLIKDDPCIELQKKAPDRRAWGEAFSASKTLATRHARIQARAEFASMLETVVKSCTGNSEQEFRKASSDNEKTIEVSDYTGLTKDFIEGVVNEIVNNTTSIDDSAYKQANGKYHVYVCIEYRGSVGEMVESLASKVDNQLSEEEKQKIQFDYQQFKKELEEQIKNMKQK